MKNYFSILLLSVSALTVTLLSSCDSDSSSAAPLTTTPSVAPPSVATTPPSTSVIITGVTAFSTAPLVFSDNHTTRLVDNSGLETVSLTSKHNMNNSSNFFSSQSNAVIDFDLGGTYHLESTYIWQSSSFASDRDVKKFDILVSADGTNFYPVLTDQTLDRSTALNRTGGAGASFAEKFLIPRTGVTHVRIHIRESYGSNVALSEVKFVGQAISAP